MMTFFGIDIKIMKNDAGKPSVDTAVVGGSSDQERRKTVKNEKKRRSSDIPMSKGVSITKNRKSFII